MNYEDKLRLAKEALASDSYDKETIEYIFPKLHESEDEKIRKELYRYFRDLQLSSDREFSPSISIDEILAWLEKQDTKFQEYINEERNKKDFYCEGKEMSWNEMPLTVRKHDYPYYFKGDLDCYPFNVEKQREQKPAWSEEDNKNLNSVKWIIENSENLNKVFETIDSPEYIKKYFIDWLKSIKPNHWKPSKEQMSMLLAVLNDSNNITAESVYIALKSLYNDLKKL